MSEKESAFIKQLRFWMITGLVGMAFTGIGFYFTTNARISYLESNMIELKQELKEINIYLRDHK